VRYECAAKPEELQMFKYHCRDCQRISGGPYSAVIYMEASAFCLTKGTIARYSTPSTMAGHNQRGFCSQCGSRVTGGEGTTGIGVTAASLDDPSWFRPQFEMWLQDAQPWETKDPNVPQFEQYPPTRREVLDSESSRLTGLPRLQVEEHPPNAVHLATFDDLQRRTIKCRIRLLQPSVYCGRFHHE
jgi:hypothetical protein